MSLVKADAGGHASDAGASALRRRDVSGACIDALRPSGWRLGKVSRWGHQSRTCQIWRSLPGSPRTFEVAWLKRYKRSAAGEPHPALARELWALRLLCGLDVPRCLETLALAEEDALILSEVRGETLRHVRLEPAEAHALLAALLRMLCFLHQRGVAHGDLNLNNVLVRERHATMWRIALVDFGSALSAPALPPQVGEVPAAPAHAAPERLGLQPGLTAAHADLYSAGSLVRKLLRMSTEAPNAAAQRAGSPPTRAGDGHLDGFVARLTHPDPRARFVSAVAALEALRAAN